MNIRPLHPNELTWANQQYSSIKFALSSDSDLMVVAEIDGVKAGLGRITQVDENAGEMGGIYVLPEFRGKSVAATIVEYLLQNNCYPRLFCIPFAHLDTFYRRYGFLPVDQSVTLPQSITKKVSWCGTTYEFPVTVLYRDNA